MLSVTIVVTVLEVCPWKLSWMVRGCEGHQETGALPRWGGLQEFWARVAVWHC